jgi:hypothetical protein
MDLSSEQISWNDIAGFLEEDRDGSTEKGEGRTTDVPLEGDLRLRAENFSQGEFTWSPLYADISLNRDRVEAEIIEAALCGIAASGVLQVDPEMVSFDLKPACEGQSIDSIINCLTGGEVGMTGHLDIQGQLAASGKGRELISTLEGNMAFSAYDGRIYHFVTWSKILALLNLTEMYRGQFPKLTGEGFAYKSISGEVTLQKGVADIKEMILDAASMEVVCDGLIDLNEEKVDLILLVAPFKTGRTIARKIPLAKHILSRAIVAVPVRVRGELGNPKVTALSPSAVASELVGVMKRTLSLPIKVIEPVIPKAGKTPQPRP